MIIKQQNKYGDNYIDDKKVKSNQKECSPIIEFLIGFFWAIVLCGTMYYSFWLIGGM